MSNEDYWYCLAAVIALFVVVRVISAILKAAIPVTAYHAGKATKQVWGSFQKGIEQTHESIERGKRKGRKSS